MRITRLTLEILDVVYRRDELRAGCQRFACQAIKLCLTLMVALKFSMSVLLLSPRSFCVVKANFITIQIFLSLF